MLRTVNNQVPAAAMNDFPAVPLIENRPHDRIREFYLYQEPQLLAAMRRGDRGAAMHIVNHVLVHIYSVGEERSDFLKGLLVELLVMISRAAVEAAVMKSEVLATNFRMLAELVETNDDEHLGIWLRNAFDHLWATIQQEENSAPPLMIGKALDFMRDNFPREITRDEAAQHAGMSPSHFSHLLKERTGRSFTQLLRRYRVDFACDLLIRSEESLAEIAGRCGFCDQSYFTRVFRDMKGVTPREFRVQAGRQR